MNEALFTTLDPNYIGLALLQLSLAFIMATILRWVYIRYGTSLSNRRSFSTNFYILAMTIAFIISIVKSSLALSLGLVGALSIVRFRTPIKEPEELAYLFLTIAIGIGLGANQIWLTITAFCIIVFAIVVHGRRRQPLEAINLNIQFSDVPDLDTVQASIAPYCSESIVRRFEKTPGSVELGLRVVLVNDQAMQAIITAITKLDDTAEIQFLNPSTIAV